MSAIQGALVEPMSVGVHAVKPHPRPAGRRGWPSTGWASSVSASSWRCGRAVSRPSRPTPRRRVARPPRPSGSGTCSTTRAGSAADAIREITDGRGVEASVDAAGVPAALAAALESTAVHGRIVVVAVPLEPLMLPIPAFRRHEVTLTMSGGQLAEDFHDTIAGMERGDYPHEGWVETIRFDDLLAEGFEPLHRQEKLKVLVDVDAG